MKIKLNKIYAKAEKLCSPVMVEIITPAWSILEKAVMKAKGEME